MACTPTQGHVDGLWHLVLTDYLCLANFSCRLAVFPPASFTLGRLAKIPEVDIVDHIFEVTLGTRVTSNLFLRLSLVASSTVQRIQRSDELAQTPSEPMMRPRWIPSFELNSFVRTERTAIGETPEHS